MKTTLHTLQISLVSFVILQSSALAQTILNADFNIGNARAGQAPDHWTITRGSADVNNIKEPLHVDAPLSWDWSDPVVNSHNGGNWLNLWSYRDDTPGHPAQGVDWAIHQDVSGFVRGGEYRFSFERAYQRIHNLSIPDLFDMQGTHVTLGFYGDTTGDGNFDTKFYSATAQATQTPQQWTVFNGNFIVPTNLQSTTVRVGFESTFSSSSLDTASYMGIDDLVVTLVPEPTTPLLLGMSGLAMCFRRSRRI